MPEVASDKNSKGKATTPEVSSDKNSKGKATPPEVAADKNQGKATRPEVTADKKKRKSLSKDDQGGKEDTPNKLSSLKKLLRFSPDVAGGNKPRPAMTVVQRLLETDDIEWTKHVAIEVLGNVNYYKKELNNRSKSDHANCLNVERLCGERNLHREHATCYRQELWGLATQWKNFADSSQAFNKKLEAEVASLRRQLSDS